MALVEVAKYYDSLTAGVARSRLAADGIECHLFDLGMTLQGVGFAIPVRLMVDEDDRDAAEAILAEDQR